MKPRSEYRVLVERTLPRRLVPGTAEQQWDYLMAVFNDVARAYQGAGITVTMCRCGRACACAPTLTVSGTDEIAARQVVEASEKTHRFW